MAAASREPLRRPRTRRDSHPIVAPTRAWSRYVYLSTFTHISTCLRGRRRLAGGTSVGRSGSGRKESREIAAILSAFPNPHACASDPCPRSVGPRGTKSAARNPFSFLRRNRKTAAECPTSVISVFPSSLKGRGEDEDAPPVARGARRVRPVHCPQHVIPEPHRPASSLAPPPSQPPIKPALCKAGWRPDESLEVRWTGHGSICIGRPLDNNPRRASAPALTIAAGGRRTW